MNRQTCLTTLLFSREKYFLNCDGNLYGQFVASIMGFKMINCHVVKGDLRK